MQTGKLVVSGCLAMGLAISGWSLVGCEQESSPPASETLQEQMEETGEATQEAAEQMQENAQEMGQDMQDAVQGMGD